jgi:hypothetical protein
MARKGTHLPTHNKQKPRVGQIFGKDGIFYTFPQGEGGPIQIRIDFSAIPVPASYYYADALALAPNGELRMTTLSFGRRNTRAHTFADRIDIVMPSKSLFEQFWASSRHVEDAVDKILQTTGLAAATKAMVLPDPEQVPTLFANTIFVAVGDGESTLDFYHLSPREVHLAKTNKINMQIQPTVRVILSSVLTKHFFNVLRPYSGVPINVLEPERSNRVARTL